MDATGLMRPVRWSSEAGGERGSWIPESSGAKERANKRQRGWR